MEPYNSNIEEKITMSIRRTMVVHPPYMGKVAGSNPAGYTSSNSLPEKTTGHLLNDDLDEKNVDSSEKTSKKYLCMWCKEKFNNIEEKYSHATNCCKRGTRWN